MDLRKISHRDFLDREITENPEFFKAFPHLQAHVRPEDELLSGQDELEPLDENREIRALKNRTPES